MPLLLATIRGDLRAAMEAEIRNVARAMRRGVERAGREVQAELRAQARGADFSDKGRALANSWRLKLYPPPGAAPRSFRPAALVYSNAPKLVEAFDKGLPITAKGGRYLAFPTGYNATRGRRGASSRGGLRVTPAEMKAARGEAFIIRSKSNPSVRLWCLPRPRRNRPQQAAALAVVRWRECRSAHRQPARPAASGARHSRPGVCPDVLSHASGQARQAA